ncbi:bone morphogenetic protein 2-like isoform X1 [Lepisosteus oculatus]|uniref:bone morphogenetic protein 2-like isoform X1 n=2 Tax=Lepisosteus oculatus TaxID=7918 RepID=UPI003717220B
MRVHCMWICSLWTLLFQPGRLLRIPQTASARQTEQNSVQGVVSQAIQKLHEVFEIGDLPPNFLPRRRPPQFMLDLFNAVADSNGITRDPGILEGNIVRSFEDKMQSDQTYHLFNLSSFGKNEKMIKAELRIFKYKHNFVAGKPFGHRFCKVDIYESLDGETKPWRGNLIASRLLPLFAQGWEVFNVTLTVSKWIHNSDSSPGFLIVTTLASGNALGPSVTTADRYQRRAGGKRAFLVLFSDDGRRASKTHISHFPGESTIAGGQAAPAPVQAENAASPSKTRSRIRTARAAPFYAEGYPKSCQRLPLYVDFEEIGWSGWIISPRGYNAYHCKGSCPFPLGEGLRATNHATVQSIVNALKLSSEVEMPCCVPDKLHSINLLYFDDEENVVLKQYDDMVAVSCGCH